MRRRSSKVGWLNIVVLCLMAAGIVMATAGRHTLRWAPPPIPASATARAPNGSAPNGSAPNGSAQPPTRGGSRPAHIAAGPTARPAPVSNPVPGDRLRAAAISPGARAVLPSSLGPRRLADRRG
jgi:hypothetical protein